MRRLRIWLLGGLVLGSLVALCGCAGSSAEAKQPAAAHAVPKAVDAGPAPTAQAAAATTPATGDALAVGTSAAVPGLPVEPPLPPELNAGVIPRATLNAVLSQGIGRFLRYVRAEPDVIKGRFAGWRITSMFADVPDIHVEVLRAGDTVRRANGRSIEHPEDFKSVWDSMATASELVLDIERAGRPSKLRYTIAH